MMIDARLSHALLGALYTAVLATILMLLGIPGAAIWAAVLVSVMFYGREAGQRDHDLERQGWGDNAAYFASQFGWGWSLDNLWQALAPAASSALVAGAFIWAPRLI